MKKRIICLVLVSVTILSSCNKDDDNIDITQFNTSLIPGEWSLTESSINDGKLSTTTNGIPVIGTFTTIGKNMDYTVNFSDSGDPKTFTSTGGYTAVVTANVLAQTFSEEQIITDLLGSGEWRAEGNTLFFNINGIEESSELSTLTAERMSFTTTFEEVVEFQGFTFDAIGTLNITLEKNK